MALFLRMDFKTVEIVLPLLYTQAILKLKVILESIFKYMNLIFCEQLN